jgi:hypothetical protein
MRFLFNYNQNYSLIYYSVLMTTEGFKSELKFNDEVTAY